MSSNIDLDTNLNKSELALKTKALIREVPDFPKPGINFYDITTLLAEGEIFSDIIDYFASRFEENKIDKIIGIESRGFIFAAAIAAKMKIGFVPVRKPGKLPYKVEKVSYQLEYGSDSLEIHQDAIKAKERVVIVDDVLATGGTASATAELVSRLDAEIIEIAFLSELSFLNGKEKIKDYNSFCLISY